MCPRGEFRREGSTRCVAPSPRRPCTPSAPAWRRLRTAGVAVTPPRRVARWLLAEAAAALHERGARPARAGPATADHDLPSPRSRTRPRRSRLIALVELARGGDAEAFGLLYDHYHAAVYRFLYYRVGSQRARRGPHLRDLLPRAAEHGLVPLAGQGLRRLADDHRAQPDHRPLQVGQAPGWR